MAVLQVMQRRSVDDISFITCFIRSGEGLGRAWLAQSVRSLHSDHKVSGAIPALPKLESFLCYLLFRLILLSFPSFRGR